MIKYRFCYPQLAAALNFNKDRVLIHEIHRGDFSHRQPDGLKEIGVISVNREDFDLGLSKGLFKDIPKIPKSNTARIKVYNKVYDKFNLRDEPMYSDKLLVSVADSASFEYSFGGKLWMEELGLKLVRRAEYEGKYTVSGLARYPIKEWSKPIITFCGIEIGSVKPAEIIIPKEEEQKIKSLSHGSFEVSIDITVSNEFRKCYERLKNDFKEFEKSTSLATQGWYFDKDSGDIFLSAKRIVWPVYTTSFSTVANIDKRLMYGTWENELIHGHAQLEHDLDVPFDCVIVDKKFESLFPEKVSVSKACDYVLMHSDHILVPRRDYISALKKQKYSIECDKLKNKYIGKQLTKPMLDAIQNELVELQDKYK